MQIVYYQIYYHTFWMAHWRRFDQITNCRQILVAGGTTQPTSADASGGKCGRVTPLIAQVITGHGPPQNLHAGSAQLPLPRSLMTPCQLCGVLWCSGTPQAPGLWPLNMQAAAPTATYAAVNVDDWFSKINPKAQPSRVLVTQKPRGSAAPQAPQVTKQKQRAGENMA